MPIHSVYKRFESFFLHNFWRNVEEDMGSLGGRSTVETNATDIVATLNRLSNRTHRGSPGGRCNGEFRFRTNA